MLSSINPQIMVSEVMTTWPETVPAFLGRRMACVGCGMARFDTLQDAARNYGLSLDDLMVDILQLALQYHSPEVSMSESQQECLVCHQTNQEVPLIMLDYQDKKYWICPQHFPILIHEPQKLVGSLPGAEKLVPHEH